MAKLMAVTAGVVVEVVVMATWLAVEGMVWRQALLETLCSFSQEIVGNAPLCLDHLLNSLPVDLKDSEIRCCHFRIAHSLPMEHK